MSGWTTAEVQEFQKQEALKMPIAEMPLPVRVVNTLENAGVFLCADLLNLTREQLLQVRNLGHKTLQEVEKALRSIGLTPPASWSSSTQAATTAVKGKTGGK